MNSLSRLMEPTDTHPTAAHQAATVPRASVLAVTCVLAAVCAPAPVDDRDSPGTPAVTNATIIDGMGGALIAGGVVVVEGDRIVAAGAAAEVAVPDGATIVDAAGGTVMPGLADMHVHMVGWVGRRQHRDARLSPLPERAAVLGRHHGLRRRQRAAVHPADPGRDRGGPAPRPPDVHGGPARGRSRADMAAQRTVGGLNHGKKSHKSNWDCMICASCRWIARSPVVQRRRENRRNLRDRRGPGRTVYLVAPNGPSG